MKDFKLKSMQEISAEEQINLTAGSGNSCSCTCGTCSCSCSSEAPSGTVKDVTQDIQNDGRYTVSDAATGNDI